MVAISGISNPCKEGPELAPFKTCTVTGVGGCFLKAFSSLFYLVINVTVCKHGVEILHTFTGTPVIVVFQALLDRPHVHGVFYDFVIILLEKQGRCYIGFDVIRFCSHLPLTSAFSSFPLLKNTPSNFVEIVNVNIHSFIF